MKTKELSEINLQWFKYFVDICNKHKIWYSVIFGTMLGTIRHSGRIPWDDDFDVMMTLDDYKKLKKLFPQHCIDGNTKKNYPLIFPQFIPEINKFLVSSIFVDIFIIIPTTKSKLDMWHSKLRKIKYNLQILQSSWTPPTIFIWIVKILTIPARILFIKKISYDTAINYLKSSNPEIHFLLHNFSNQHIRTMHNFNYNVVLKKFEDFEVSISAQYEALLITSYGENYMIPVKDKVIHINTISTKKAKI